jgi:hypothetical protein
MGDKDGRADGGLAPGLVGTVSNACTQAEVVVLWPVPVSG